MARGHDRAKKFCVVALKKKEAHDERPVVVSMNELKR